MSRQNRHKRDVFNRKFHFDNCSTRRTKTGEHKVFDGLKYKTLGGGVGYLHRDGGYRGINSGRLDVRPNVNRAIASGRIFDSPPGWIIYICVRINNPWLYIVHAFRGIRNMCTSCGNKSRAVIARFVYGKRNRRIDRAVSIKRCRHC